MAALIILIFRNAQFWRVRVYMFCVALRLRIALIGAPIPPIPQAPVRIGPSELPSGRVFLFGLRTRIPAGRRALDLVTGGDGLSDREKPNYQRWNVARGLPPLSLAGIRRDMEYLVGISRITPA